MTESPNPGGNEGGGNGGANYTSWPATQITAAMKNNAIPAYAGTATGFTFASATISGVTVATVTVVGGSSGDCSTYESTLTSNGYVFGSDGYKKTLTNGDSISVTATFVNPDGSSPMISMTISYNENKGSLSSWPATQIAEVLTEKTIPAFSGATSFDFNNYSGSVVVTAYGVSSEEVAAYKTALTTAGFAATADENEFGYTLANNDVLQIDLSYVSAYEKVVISTSIEEYIAPTYTLPTNVKITYTSLYGTFTVQKVGDNYFNEMGNVRTFLKKTATGWTKYESTYEYDEEAAAAVWTAWEEQETYTAATVKYAIEDVLGWIVDNDLEDFVKGETAVIAGITCDIYTDTYSISIYTCTEVKYVATNSKLVMKNVSTTNGTVNTQNEITVYNTSATSFEITAP